VRIVIATRNRHKVSELAALLGAQGLELVCAADLPGAPEVDEDGDTFEANAAKKAIALARFSGGWALADDSGLEVDALGGAPGVQSARYAGPAARDKDNLHKLLTMMRGVTDRRARFRCVLALSGPDGNCRTVAGSCEGVILEAARGTGGFGYDPVFVPDGHTLTFAELPADAKNAISHRGRALARARQEWVDVLRGG
jgi:XTP/dITP diphosphohydrolase